MNKLGLSLLCGTMLLSSVGLLQAKEHDMRPEPQKMERMHKMKRPDLVKKLNLTEEQKEQAEKIREDGREKMKKMHKQMQELRKENMAEFEKILTPEQKAEFEKIKAEHKEKFGKHKGKKWHKRPPFEVDDDMLPPPPPPAK